MHTVNATKKIKDKIVTLQLFALSLEANLEKEEKSFYRKILAFHGYFKTGGSFSDAHMGAPTMKNVAFVHF